MADWDAVSHAPAATDPWVVVSHEDQKPKTSQALGFEQVIGRTLANAAGIADKEGRFVGLPMDKLEGWLYGGKTLPQVQQQIANPEHAPNVTPGGIGSFIGSLPAVAAGAPLGPLFGSAVAAGLTSDKTTPGGVATDAVLGGVLGKTTDIGLGAAKNIISPNLSPAVQRLMAAKIPLTPGQTIGGAAKAVEDKLTSIPLVGDMIGNAQRNSVKGFNRAVLDSALDPIGAKLPGHIDAGREGVDYVANEIGKRYDLILPKMTGALDQQLQSDINGIGQQAIGSGVKQDVLDRFNNVLKAQIVDRVGPGGTLTGQALKDAQQNLGGIGRKLAASQDADSQQLGDLVMDAHSAFNDMLARNNPQRAGDLQAANKAWAQYVRIRRAASSVGSKDGVFSPPQYANAVKAMDASAGKGNYARGNALMQDLSDAANQVLPSTVPDSGTIGRGLAAALLTGGIPILPKVAIPGAIAAGVYTKPGQVAARALLGGSRPAWAPATAKMVDLSRLPLSLGAATAAPALLPTRN